MAFRPVCRRRQPMSSYEENNEEALTVFPQTGDGEEEDSDMSDKENTDPETEPRTLPPVNDFEQPQVRQLGETPSRQGNVAGNSRFGTPATDNMDSSHQKTVRIPSPLAPLALSQRTVAVNALSVSIH